MTLSAFVALAPKVQQTCINARACAAKQFSPPVIFRGGAARVSYAKVLEQCVESLKNSNERLLTIDFPPERSETRAGTLVSRYENNLNFLERVMETLGCTGSVPVGGLVSICDNVNPQGGGEYLTDDECMVGRRVPACTALNGSGLTMLINAGVDASTLKEVRKLDNGSDIVVLLNCGLERVSWFAKLSFRDYIDEFVPLYYLKNVAGNGWLLKCGQDPWRAYIANDGHFQCVYEVSERPKIVDVEAEIRIALAKVRN